jgi:topoisomerase-4 subunit A
MEIRKEHNKLSKEQSRLQGLLSSEAKRWTAIADEVRETRRRFGEETELGRRRTIPGTIEATGPVDETAFIEREPITVILSEKGWIRAQKGHLGADAELRFKEGDSLKQAIHAETTDRIVVLATNGKAYTVKADSLPRGRGDGQPVRLLLDLGNGDDVVTLFIHRDGRRFLVAATDGKGFVVKGEELLAEKRTGKQVLVMDTAMEALLCIPAEGDSVATIGSNNRLLVFPLSQVPEMTRGRGVQLMQLRDGATLQDAKVFTAKEGLSWRYGGGVKVETDLRTWSGQRAGAGKMPPDRFPKSRKFGV